MAKQTINVGTTANSGGGDPLRSAMIKINENFTEVYDRVGVTETQLGLDNKGGATIEQSIIGSVIGADSTVILDHTTGTITGKLVGDVTGSVVADDSTVLIDGVAGTINGSALTSPLTANLTINSPIVTGIADFTGCTIVDFKTASVDFTGSTLTGTGFLSSAEIDTKISTATSSIVIPSGSTQSIDVVAADSTVLVDSVNGTLNATTLTGALPAINGSALTNITTTFANITSTPTTLAGYGITDAATLNNMAPTGAVDFTGATTIDFNTVTINNLEFADISAKPTTLAGYGITDATSSASPAFTGAVDFTGATSVNFTGATVTGLTVTETDPVVGAITGLVKADGSGNISAAVAGTDYSTFDGAFGSLSGKPTTLAGYGITDAASTSATTTFTADVKFDQGVTESFATYNNVSGVVAMDCDHGHLFYVTNATGDITTNLTNFGLTAEYGTNITVIINQGATPYEVTAVQIGGAAQTINWQGGSAPTGNANGIDSFSFTILNDGGTYVVLGQMVDFT